MTLTREMSRVQHILSSLVTSQSIQLVPTVIIPRFLDKTDKCPSENTKYNIHSSLVTRSLSWLPAVSGGRDILFCSSNNFSAPNRNTAETEYLMLLSNYNIISANMLYKQFQKYYISKYGVNIFRKPNSKMSGDGKTELLNVVD